MLQNTHLRSYLRSISFPNVSWQLYTKPGATISTNIASRGANRGANMGATTGANKGANSGTSGLSDKDANARVDGIHVAGVDVTGVRVG